MSATLATMLASILVAMIAAFSAYASQKQASKAVTTTNRLDFEKEAFDRARKYDTDTIARQDLEIEELRQQFNTARNENLELRQELETVRRENVELRSRIYTLEVSIYQKGTNSDNRTGGTDPARPNPFEGGSNSD